MYRVLENSSATLLILCARALCDVWNIHPLYLGVRCDRYHKEARSTVHGKEITMTDLAVRPFRIDVPEEDLVDLRRRVAATRWPDRETVTDQSQSVQLAKIQELVRYWGTDYDSLVIAAAIDAGCTRLYSENLQDGQRIEGLTVENPFREL